MRVLDQEDQYRRLDREEFVDIEALSSIKIFNYPARAPELTCCYLAFESLKKVLALSKYDRDARSAAGNSGRKLESLNK